MGTVIHEVNNVGTVIRGEQLDVDTVIHEVNNVGTVIHEANNVDTVIHEVIPRAKLEWIIMLWRIDR